MSTPSKNYMFTIQYTGEPPVVSSADAVLEHASYMVYQSEMAPTTGQLHLQGFIHLKSFRRPKGVKEIICSLFSVSSAHITKGDGKAGAMSDYCQKEDTRVPGTQPVIFGVLPNPPGKNNVGATLSKMYLDYHSKSVTLHDLTKDENTSSLALRYGKMFEYVAQSSIPPRSSDNPHVVWVCYGPPGTGKSTWLEEHVRKLHGEANVYMKPEGTKWWCKYLGQKHVIMNEFDGTWCTPTLFNTWCDRFATQVETKGGSVELATIQTYITTNRYPSHWWSSKVMKGRLTSLWRRITKVLEFTALGEEPVIWDDIGAFRAHHSYDESRTREELYGTQFKSE